MGRLVCKRFGGAVAYRGTILSEMETGQRSLDDSVTMDPRFKVLFDDGDEEIMELDELAEVLVLDPLEKKTRRLMIKVADGGVHRVRLAKDGSSADCSLYTHPDLAVCVASMRGRQKVDRCRRSDGKHVYRGQCSLCKTWCLQLHLCTCTVCAKKGRQRPYAFPDGLYCDRDCQRNHWRQHAKRRRLAK